jgi:hypothetical protein
MHIRGLLGGAEPVVGLEFVILLESPMENRRKGFFRGNDGRRRRAVAHQISFDLRGRVRPLADEVGRNLGGDLVEALPGQKLHKNRGQSGNDGQVALGNV